MNLGQKLYASRTSVLRSMIFLKNHATPSSKSHFRFLPPIHSPSSFVKMVSILQRMRKLQTVRPPSITRPAHTNKQCRKYLVSLVSHDAALTPTAPSNQTRFRCCCPPKRCLKNPHALRAPNRRRPHGTTKVLATRTRTAEIPQPSDSHDHRPHSTTDGPSDHDDTLHIGRLVTTQLWKRDGCACADR